MLNWEVSAGAQALLSNTDMKAQSSPGYVGGMMWLHVLDGHGAVVADPAGRPLGAAQRGKLGAVKRDEPKTLSDAVPEQPVIPPRPEVSPPAPAPPWEGGIDKS